MKKSYVKMLIFQLVIFLVFALNSFVSNILGGYNFIIFLLISLVAFKFIFGFERDRHRFTKDLFFEIIIFFLIFFILFYLFGVIIGFAKTNYYSWYGLKTFIIPLVITIILKEVLRYMMLKKIEGSKFLLVTSVVLFVFLDITETVYYNSFNSGYDTFMFIALSLLPSISNNIICSYIVKISGYKPSIFYLLIIKLYVYLLPIIPDPDEYLTSIINFILPIFLGNRIYNFFQKEKDEDLEREYNKKNIIGLIIPLVFTVVIVYFTSGYFRYYALAIASGSMHPAINKGDVVIVEKYEDNYERLKVDDVIAYEHSGVVVVHRIINIVKTDGKYYFYTKGDNNNGEDNYSVEQEMIIGKVTVRLPYVGMPTVWLNE